MKQYETSNRGIIFDWIKQKPIGYAITTDEIYEKVVYQAISKRLIGKYLDQWTDMAMLKKERRVTPYNKWTILKKFTDYV